MEVVRWGWDGIGWERVGGALRNGRLVIGKKPNQCLTFIMIGLLGRCIGDNLAKVVGVGSGPCRQIAPDGIVAIKPYD